MVSNGDEIKHINWVTYPHSTHDIIVQAILELLKVFFSLNHKKSVYGHAAAILKRQVMRNLCLYIMFLDSDYELEFIAVVWPF